MNKATQTTDQERSWKILRTAAVFLSVYKTNYRAVLPFISKDQVLSNHSGWVITLGWLCFVSTTWSWSNYTPLTLCLKFHPSFLFLLAYLELEIYGQISKSHLKNVHYFKSIKQNSVGYIHVASPARNNFLSQIC